MKLFFSSTKCRHRKKKLFERKISVISYRSYSHEEIHHKTSHHRSNSSYSADIFTLMVPTTNGSLLSPLICPICSLPMIKPTLLPCQHTFCFDCILNSQQTRSSSLPIHSNNCFLSNPNQTIIIKCQKCSRIHSVKSLSDLEKNSSIELLINTLLCEKCQELYRSNQLDTCTHCFRVLCPKCYDEHVQDHENNFRKGTDIHRIESMNESPYNNAGEKNLNENDQNSLKNIFKSKSFNTEKKSTTESIKRIAETQKLSDENTDPSEITNTKKKSNNPLYNIMKSRHRQSNSLSNKDSNVKCSSPFLKRKLPTGKGSRSKQLIVDTNVEETTTMITATKDTEEIPVPITPVGQFLSLHDQYMHTDQYIKQCKQRQSELDRVVKKLIDVLTIKTTENINQISQYWMHLKQLLLSRYQLTTNRYKIFNYFIKNCCSISDPVKQIDLSIEKNDEIKASLEVLSTTLTIVASRQSLLTINQLFDREQQATLRALREHLDSLLSSYSDALSYISEFINAYEARFASWKDPKLSDLNSITEGWTKIIKEDYPKLVAKISEDFITTTPQLETVLVKMLRNMKLRLLNVNNQSNMRRTSPS